MISACLVGMLALAASAQPLRDPDVTEACADTARAALEDTVVEPQHPAERQATAARTPYAADFPEITVVPGRLGVILRALVREIRELAAAASEVLDSAVTKHDCTMEVVP
jgi:hypothetical protein